MQKILLTYSNQFMSKYYFGRQAYLNQKMWGNVFEKPAENPGETKKQEQKTQPVNKSEPFRFGSEAYKMANEIEQAAVDFKNKERELKNALKNKLKK